MKKICKNCGHTRNDPDFGGTCGEHGEISNDYSCEDWIDYKKQKGALTER